MIQVSPYINQERFKNNCYLFIGIPINVKYTKFYTKILILSDVTDKFVSILLVDILNLFYVSFNMIIHISQVLKKFWYG